MANKLEINLKNSINTDTFEEDFKQFDDTTAPLLENTGIERDGGITNIYETEGTFTNTGENVVTDDGKVISVVDNNDGTRSVYIDNKLIGATNSYGIESRVYIDNALDVILTSTSYITLVLDGSTIVVSEYDFNKTLLHTRDIIFTNLTNILPYKTSLSFVKWYNQAYADSLEFTLRLGDKVVILKESDLTVTITNSINSTKVLGDSTINVVVEYGTTLVFAGDNGRVGSFDGTNWKNYDGSGTGLGIFNNGDPTSGPVGSANILCATVFENSVVFGSVGGRVGSYDGSSWFTYLSPIGIANNSTVVSTDDITCMSTYGPHIAFASSLGKLGSYNSYTNSFVLYSAGSGLCDNATLIGAVSINSMITMTDIDGFPTLVVGGDSGRVGSMKVVPGTTLYNDTANKYYHVGCGINGLLFSTVTNDFPSTGYAFYSEDNGVTWKDCTTNPPNTSFDINIFNIKYVNSTYMSVGDSGCIWVSSDGKVWSRRSYILGLSFPSWATDGSTIVVVDGGTSTDTIVYYSLDYGYTWNTVTVTGAQLGNISYGNGYFCAVRGTLTSSVLWYSQTGYSGWTSQALPSTAAWRGVVNGSNTWVVTKDTGGGAYKVGNPGGTFTAFTLSGMTGSQVVYGNGKFMTSLGATPAYSINGSAWTLFSGAPTNSDLTFNYNANEFIFDSRTFTTLNVARVRSDTASKVLYTGTSTLIYPASNAVVIGSEKVRAMCEFNNQLIVAGGTSINSYVGSMNKSTGTWTAYSATSSTAICNSSVVPGSPILSLVSFNNYLILGAVSGSIASINTSNSKTFTYSEIVANIDSAISLPNSTFETDLTGWNLYMDPAHPYPTNGSGGIVTAFTFTRDTTTPLFGTASGSLNAFASGAGQGVSTDFEIPSDLAGSNIVVSFVYSITSNFPSNYIGIYIYDITNDVLLTATNNNVLPQPTANTKNSFSVSFMSNSNSTNYRLCFHSMGGTVISPPASLLLDNVTVGLTPTIYNIVDSNSIKTLTNYSNKLLVTGANITATINQDGTADSMYRNLDVINDNDILHEIDTLSYLYTYKYVQGVYLLNPVGNKKGLSYVLYPDKVVQVLNCSYALPQIQNGLTRHIITGIDSSVSHLYDSDSIKATGLTGFYDFNTLFNTSIRSVNLTLLAGCAVNGNIVVTLPDTSSVTIAVTTAASTPALVATLIASTTFGNWTVTSSGATVSFFYTLNQQGLVPLQNPLLSTASTGVTGFFKYGEIVNAYYPDATFDVSSISKCTAGFGYQDFTFNKKSNTAAIYNYMPKFQKTIDSLFQVVQSSTDTLVDVYGKLTNNYEVPSAKPFEFRSCLINGVQSYLSVAQTDVGSTDMLGTLITNVGEFDDTYQIDILNDDTILYRYNNQFVITKIGSPENIIQRIDASLYKINSISPLNLVNVTESTLDLGSMDYNGRMIFTSSSASTTSTKIASVINRYKKGTVDLISNSVDVGDKLVTIPDISIDNVEIVGYRIPTSGPEDFGVDTYVDDLYGWTTLNSGSELSIPSKEDTLYVTSTFIPNAIDLIYGSGVAYSGNTTIFLKPGFDGNSIGNEIIGTYNKFSLLGQNYLNDSQYIYITVIDAVTGIFASKSALAPIDGLRYIASTPNEVYFLSEFDNSLYTFTGGRSLNKIKRLTQLESVNSGVYSSSENSLLLDTDNTFIFVRDNIITKNNKKSTQTNLKYYNTTNGIIIANNTNTWKYSYKQGTSVVPLIVQTPYYGFNIDAKSILSEWIVTIYNKDKTSTDITATSYVIDEDVSREEITQLTINPSQFNSGGYARFRIQPQYMRSLGTSLKLSTNNKLIVVSIVPAITVGETAVIASTRTM